MTNFPKPVYETCSVVIEHETDADGNDLGTFQITMPHHQQALTGLTKEDLCHLSHGLVQAAWISLN